MLRYEKGGGDEMREKVNIRYCAKEKREIEVT